MNLFMTETSPQPFHYYPSIPPLPTPTPQPFRLSLPLPLTLPNLHNPNHNIPLPIFHRRHAHLPRPQRRMPMHRGIARRINDILDLLARQHAVANIRHEADAQTHKGERVGEGVGDEQGVGFVGVAVDVVC